VTAVNANLCRIYTRYVHFQGSFMSEINLRPTPALRLYPAGRSLKVLPKRRSWWGRTPPTLSVFGLIVQSFGPSGLRSCMKRLQLQFFAMPRPMSEDINLQPYAPVYTGCANKNTIA